MSINKESNSNLSWASMTLNILRSPRLLITAVAIFAVAIFMYYKFFQPHRSAPLPISCKSWTLIGRLITKQHRYLNADNLKVGMYSGPFTSDDKIVNGIFRITSAQLPSDNFIQLYLESNGQQIPFYKEPLDINKQIIDSNECTITFREDISINLNPEKIGEKKNVADKNQLKKILSFSIVNPELDPLKTQLLKSGYRFTFNHPDFQISLKYSGKIETVGENLFRYNGGYLNLMINNLQCCILDSLKISSTSPFGNSLTFVETTINSEIKQFISTRVLYVYKKIDQCIN